VPYCFTALAGFHPQGRTTLSSRSRGSPTCCNGAAEKAADLRRHHHHVPRHEPILIAVASSRTTAGSRCGSFSQAELTADRVIPAVSPGQCRCPPLSSAAWQATSKVTAAGAVTAGGELVPRPGARPPGQAAIAAELLLRTRAESPVLAGLGEREELLVAAWLASLLRAAPGAPMPTTCGGGWDGWPTGARMCWRRAGCTWTCGWRHSGTAARRPQRGHQEEGAGRRVQERGPGMAAPRRAGSHPHPRLPRGQRGQGGAVRRL
jgi:hypothetical protein